MEKALKIQILCQFCDGQAIQWKFDECEKFMCLPCKELVHDNLKSLQHHGIANLVDIVKNNPNIGKDNPAQSEVASEVIFSVLNSYTTSIPIINSLVCSEDGCVYFMHQKIAEKGILGKGEPKESAIKLSKSLKKRIFDIAINRDEELLFNEMVDNNNDNELIVGIKEQGPIFQVQKDSVRQVINFGSYNKKKVTLEIDTKGRKLFNYPARIETDSANVLYVADWMDTDLSGRIVAVDTNGNLKFAYEGHQYLKPFFPHGIAITPSDNIILSDQSNKALHVLNSTGELLGLHLKDSILHIKAPLSLCFDHEGHLLIGSGKLDNGINVLPSKSLECKNLLSTKKFPDDVTKLVDDELRKGYLIGPFTKPPFDTYRISPIGIVEGKYSKKKRLILDLSAPHNNDEHHSINDLINKEDYSLTYVRIDDAINIIKSLGIKSQLCKCDVTDAFKLIPVHNSLWRFYGLKWNDMYYFYTRLAFGCRSSPKIFDTLSVAICWILQNNYGLRHVLHLLDDFLLINNPYVDATRNMNTMLYVFNSLKIPLSAHKTVGPSTSLEYLGIILDSMHMIAKLPDEKLVRIKDILYSYLNRRSCTKREMLSLLGHLNYACKVIIPGRSFVSYLLTLAHSVKELYHHVTITKGCRDDMAMWFKFLSQWNGISFFISDNVINASDFHLFTDASSTIGYGGYFRKRWFQGIWPDDFIRPDEESFSMAYLELYPIVISAILWGHEWSTKRILFHCDNMSSVYIINKGRSKCNVIMNLVRRLTWCAAKFNFVVHAVHVPGKENNIADALSRYQMKRFRQLAPDASPNPCTCPPHSEILCGVRSSSRQLME
ncbi:Hypothetical predicted protein [Mytilus galloprovincialis]|uniref:Reverse transcriptase domain-containing protein n=1 Tax=Mytilus galloprovincialis TaxID=29158 RepID=A0A8B6BV82_MYTGA|nr:Hypothetical predicted protein [Mytilus galloprovincialis]